MTGLAEALATPGLGWLVLTAAVAGVVRGYLGFGTALTFIPVATRFVDPATAVIAQLVMDFVGPVPLLPRAVRDMNRRHLRLLAVGAILCQPLGVALLIVLDPVAFRWSAALLAALALTALVAGWRYRGEASTPAILGTGAATGVLSGAAGLSGPPVAIFYLGGPWRPEVARGTILVLFFILEVTGLGFYAASGVLTSEAVWLGLVLIPPYLAGTLTGGRLFDPRHAGLFRWLGYAVIAGAILVALPVFD